MLTNGSKIDNLKEKLDEASNAQCLWRFTAKNKVRGLHAADIDADGQVEAIVGTDENIIYLLNANDGKPDWRFQANAWVPSVYAASVQGEVGSRVIAGSDDGYIYALDAKGKELWRFGTSLRMRSVYAADVDQDDYVEILAASFNKHLYVFDNDGKLKRSYDTDELVFKLRAQDINGDGQVEIAAATDSGKILLLDYKGENPRAVSCAKRAFALELADIDGDGHAEVIAGSFDNHLYVWDGWTLELKWKKDMGDRVYAVRAIDIDADGELEVLVSTRDRYLKVVNSQGQLEWQFALEHWAFDVWVGDVNGDGLPELLTCSEMEDCAQLYSLPNVRELREQIRQAYDQIEEKPALDWNLSREQWELLSLVIPDINLPERATDPGVCDRHLRLDKARALLEDGNYQESLRQGLELNRHRLDFAWDYDLEAELRDLEVLWDETTSSPIILCAPDHRAFFAINSAGNEVINEEVPFPCRRVLVASLFPGRKTIIVGLNQGLYTYEYPQGVGVPLTTTDWVQDIAVGLIDEAEPPAVFVASFDGRVYAWNYRMTIEWFYPAENKQEPVYAVYALDSAWQAEARVIIGSFDGTVEALDKSGKRVWRYDCDDRIFVIRAADFSPTGKGPARPLILVGSDDGKVYALDTNGTLRWHYHTGAPIKWIEVFDIDEDGLLEILVSASDGHFYILDAEGDSKLECQLGSWIQGLQVEDIDADGRTEICFGLRNRKKLFVYRFLPKRYLEAFLNECIETWQKKTEYEVIIDTLRTETNDLLRAYGVRLWLDSSQFEESQVESVLQDRSENVRLELALVLPSLLKRSDIALDWLERISRDPSWRVRYQLATNLSAFYATSSEMAERCFKLLQNDDHPRVLRRLVRSLVKMLHVGDWPYQKLLEIAQQPEVDTWVENEVVRGLASFLDDYPERTIDLLELSSCDAIIPAILELLDEDGAAFHILTLCGDLETGLFNESVKGLAEYTVTRLNRGVDSDALQVVIPDSVQVEGGVYAAFFRNVKPIFGDYDLPDDFILPILFQKHKVLNTRDLRSLLGDNSIGIFVSFDEAIPRQTLDLLRSLSFNYKLAALTYKDFLHILSVQDTKSALNDVLKRYALIEIDHWLVPFIGRSSELEAIKNHLLAWRKQRIVFIQGSGGIGKTRLLHEIDRYFSTVEIDIPIIMLSIMDFDDDKYKIPRNICVNIARQLDPEQFSPYLDSIRQMYLAEEGLATSEFNSTTQHKRFALDRQFIDCFNKASRNQRVVLRLDTTDALSHDMPIAELLSVFYDLDNVLILIAGRNTEKLYKKYGKAMNGDTDLIQLPPFTLSDSRAYLEKKQDILKIALASEWMEKLFILADGLPVLIDLAIEWAQGHRPLPWMEQISLSELQALQEEAKIDSNACDELDSLQKKFRKIVVMPLADLRNSLDHLKLVLAKVHPLDLEGVMEMLNLRRKDAERLITEAKQSVSVKRLPDGRIKLHDEVERLVNKYVWPRFDRDGGRELRDSRRAIAYLTKKSEMLLKEIQQLKESEIKSDIESMRSYEPVQILELFGERYEKQCVFETLRIERLRRQLAIDVLVGYEMFEDDYDLPEASWPYRQGLLDQITPYVDWHSPREDAKGNTLPESKRMNVQRTLAHRATFAGLYERAAEIYKCLLERVSKKSEEYPEILVGQANQLVRAGDLQEAVEVTQKALGAAKRIKSTEWLMKSTLALGWIYRLKGDLGKALKHYQDALKMAADYEDDEQIALISRNIAYVYALQGQEKQALEEIRQSILVWRRMMKVREESRFGLGQCYNTAGEICLELERSTEALQYFELSCDIFDEEEVESISDEIGAAEWKSKARSGRGFAHWQLAVADLRRKYTDSAQRNLKDALRDLDWAAEYATETDRPAILNRRGEVHFWIKNYQAARDDWQKSLREAKKIGDAFNEFLSLGNLVRLAFYVQLEKFPTLYAFEQRYIEYQSRYQIQFDLLLGLFRTYLGHLALKQEDISKASVSYEEGLPLLAQVGMYDPFNLSGQLDFIESEVLPNIPSTLTHQIGEVLEKKWDVESHGVWASTYFRRWSHWSEQIE